MTEPLPQLPPKTSPVLDFFRDPTIQRWIERIILGVVVAYFSAKMNLVHQDVNSAKDIAADTNKTQKAVVAVEVRGNPQDVEALRATTQEAK
jgi:hypothetical protein